MIKLKSLITTTWLLCYLNYEIHGLIESKQWRTEYPFHPSVVQAKDRLLVVGFHNNTVIINNATGDTNHPRICKSSLPSENYSIWTMNRFFPSLTLGNGKILVSVELITSEEFAHVIIDPYNCSNIKVIKQVINEKTFIVPYYDSFDVFYQDYNRRSYVNETKPKMPLRYNDRGEEIELDHYMTFNEKHYSDFVLIPAEEYDPSQGYFLLIMYFNNTITYQRLNSRFEQVGKLRLLDSDIADNYFTRKAKMFSPGWLKVCSRMICVSQNLDTNEQVVIRMKSNDFVGNPVGYMCQWPDGGFIGNSLQKLDHIYHSYVFDVRPDGSTESMKVTNFSTPGYTTYSGLFDREYCIAVIKYSCPPEKWKICEKFIVEGRCFVRQSNSNL